MEQGVTQQQFTKAIDGIMEALHFIVEHTVTKDELEGLRKEFKGDIAESRQEMVARLQAVEKGQDEILELIHPMSRAQDQDSITLISHERRITHLEEAIA